MQFYFTGVSSFFQVFILKSDTLTFLFTLASHKLYNYYIGPCPPIPHISNGQATPLGSAAAQAACNPGFRLVGTNVISCVNGQWVTLPRCERGMCSCKFSLLMSAITIYLIEALLPASLRPVILWFYLYVNKSIDTLLVVFCCSYLPNSTICTICQPSNCLW